ncbi:MAG: Cell division ATP-binding protein FtsE [Syntrophomonadaceae bacterium]|nr:Cell division ATP-binding protein FtsE [Bacillota bacterium]
MELKGLDKGLIESKVDDTLEQFQIKELEKAFPFQLSRGEKQRLAIASIMINNPPFFILDEPTTGLDIERKGILSTLIGNLLKNGIGMVIISHDRAFVKKHGQRVISMLEGEIGYDETSIY